mgnify:CR=1 FL=1
MKKLVLIAIALILVVAGCQSPEMTAAKVYVQQNDYQAAIDQLKKAEQKEPMNAEVYFLEGKIYAEMDSFELMTRAFDRALELDITMAEDIEAWRLEKRAEVFRKGQKSGESQKWDRAIQYTKTAVMIDPEFFEGWYNLGFFYQKKGDFEKAMEAYEQAYEINPLDLVLAKQMAIARYRDEDTDAAIRILQKIVEEGEPDLEVYTLLAQLHMARTEFEAADSLLDVAQAMAPDNAGLLFDRGTIKYAREDYESAIEYFQNSLELEPENRDALYNLSLSYFSSEDYEKAVEAAEKLVKNNPQDQQGWEQYALSLLRDGKTDKGKAATLVAESIGLLESGETVSAIANLKQVTDKYPDWCAAWAVLKVSCEEAGNAECAAEAQAGLDACGN